MDIESLPERLRGLIGTRVQHQGQTCRVIEVVEPGPMLVLQCENLNGVIQPNQYGDATRRVPKTISVPVLSEDGGELHPEFRLLKVW